MPPERQLISGDNFDIDQLQVWIYSFFINVIIHCNSNVLLHAISLCTKSHNDYIDIQWLDAHYRYWMYVCV